MFEKIYSLSIVFNSEIKKFQNLYSKILKIGQKIVIVNS
jgi:hypothetical protein